jgi:hypothetical protein
MPEEVDKGTAGPEVKTLKNYPGLYGRLFLASAAKESDIVHSIIDSSTDIGINPSEVRISDDRTYNPITGKSLEERAAAWQGVSFDQAYQQWKKEFTQVINGIAPTETNRLAAFHAVFKDRPATEFRQADAETLYNRFCQGESNVDGFVKTVIGNLKADRRTLDDALLNDLEWVSRKLFGKQTAIAVSRIIEIETEMADNPKDFVRVIFSDPTRINNLNIEEKNILAFLHDGLKAEPIVESSSPEPGASAQPTETEDEEIRSLKNQIEAIKRGEKPSFVSMGGPETALRYLEKQLAEAEARKQKTTAPAGPTAAPETHKEDFVAPVSPAQPAGIKAEPQHIPPKPAIQPEPAMPENTGAVELQGKDFAGELNANLLNQPNPDATFSIPIETVKGYLTSIAGNRLIYEGNLTVDKDHNTIVIKGLKIDGGFAGGKITLDLSITNSSKGISAQIQNYDGRGLARGTVEQKVGSLDSTFRDMVDALVATQNPAWKSNSIEISGERIKINFHNTKSTTGNLPS